MLVTESKWLMTGVKVLPKCDMFSHLPSVREVVVKMAAEVSTLNVLRQLTLRFCETAQTSDRLLARVVPVAALVALPTFSSAASARAGRGAETVEEAFAGAAQVAAA
eukprot:6196112-Pleurochrysis_carterae.AAC.3